MPPPLSKNAYKDIVEAARKAAQTVCQHSMTAAGDDANRFYEPEEDGVFDMEYQAMAPGEEGATHPSMG